jgi:hypothetical protein
MAQDTLPISPVMQTRFVVTVRSRIPLSEADMRFLERDMQNRLHNALVQKIADVTFTAINGDSEIKEPPGLMSGLNYNGN